MGRFAEYVREDYLEIGLAGEDQATQYLLDRGYSVLERNWSCRLGELDIIALSPPREKGGGRVLVIVEVKSRWPSAKARQHLFDNITFHKQRKLRTLCELYLRRHSELMPGPRNARGIAGVQIDVIGVLTRGKQQPPDEIIHLKAAVSAA